MENLSIKKIILLVGVIMLTTMYFFSGINKIQNFSATASGLSKKPIFKMLPELFSKLSLLGVIVLELIAPIIILLAIFNSDLKNLASLSAIGLGIFTLFATLLYHFPPNGVEFYFFMKNITIIGGFIVLALFFDK